MLKKNIKDSCCVCGKDWQLLNYRFIPIANLVLGIIFIVWHTKANKAEKAYVQTGDGQAKIENAQKLLKIAQANRVNPYADITPMELGFGFPFVEYM